MTLAFVVVVCATAGANAFAATADLRRADFVLETSRQVGVPASWLPPLAAAKGAGALGLALGLVGDAYGSGPARAVGVAAAVGLVLFFTGALIAHVRAGVLHNLYFPGIFWLLAAGSLAGFVSQA